MFYFFTAIYLNPGNDNFAKSINSEIFVDKTGLIKYTNKVFNTMQEFLSRSDHVENLIDRLKGQ